ncbi:MAG: hypothetical protein JF614_29060 [Acidobacteria bacterium]|nr:hypothetical protein [Acidobacteriota bacterium]
MPELNEDCTKRLPPAAPPAPPPPDDEDEPAPPSVAPPEVDPDRWERFPTFRETFLVYFTTPAHNAALRVVGNLLFDMTLAAWGEWPDQPEGWLRGQLRAVVADLRHLEGYLVTLAEAAPADAYEGALCRTAVLMSREVGDVAQNIESKLGTWRGGEVS